jgi:hypothetical protein
MIPHTQATRMFSLTGFRLQNFVQAEGVSKSRSARKSNWRDELAAKLMSSICEALFALPFFPKSYQDGSGERGCSAIVD